MDATDHPERSATESQERWGPRVDVATVVLTLGDEGLDLVLTLRAHTKHRRGVLAPEHEVDGLIPRVSFLPGDDLTTAAERAVRRVTPGPIADLRQLWTVDGERDQANQGWAITVVYRAVVTAASAATPRSDGSPRTAVVPWALSGGERPRLGDQDGLLAEVAVETVRQDYQEVPDPYWLLDEPFTLRQLQTLHELVLGEPVVKDAFRRRMATMLEPTGQTAAGTVGKPAALWRHAQR